MLNTKENTGLVLSVLTAVAVLVLGAHCVWASGEGWMTDFDAAKKKAAKEGKDLLVDFSGSDWCGWCIKLDKEVFSHEEFRKEASKNYILVVLDFPRKPENKEKIPVELRKRNDELKAEFGLTGYPSIYLTNSKGTPYAKTGYRAGGPENYLKELAAFREKKVQRDKLMARANAEGIKSLERAKLLHKALEMTDKSLVDQFHGKDMAEIIKLDPENEAGLKNKYEMRLRLADARKAMSAGKMKEAIKVFQSAIDDLKPTGEDLQDVLFAKGEAHFRMQDKEGMRKCLEEARKAAPKSKKAGQIQAMLKRFFPEEKKEEKKETP